jgi:DNA-binding response OmpR family regulator
MAKILLAESENQRARLMERTLCEARFVVETVGDGEQAEAWAKVNDYEAVILALDLPRRSGLDICRNLREHDADTPIMLLGRREQLP